MENPGITILDIINCIAGCFAAIGTVGATIFALYSTYRSQLHKLKFKFRSQYDKDGVLSRICIDLINRDNEDITLFYLDIEAHNKKLEGSKLAHTGILMDIASLYAKEIECSPSLIIEQSDGIVIKGKSILTLKVPQGENGINLQNGHVLSVTVTDSRGKKKKSYKVKIEDVS